VLLQDGDIGLSGIPGIVPGLKIVEKLGG